MNLINYSSDTESDSGRTKKPKLTSTSPLNHDSQVAIVANHDSQVTILANPNDQQINVHVPQATYDEQNKPLVGPINPFAPKRATVVRNIMSGRVEEHHIDPLAFKMLERNFARNGWTLDPDSNLRIGEVAGEKGGEVLGERGAKSNSEKNPRLAKTEVSDVDGWQGPWRGFVHEVIGVRERTDAENIYVAPPPIDIKALDEAMEDVPVVEDERSVYHGPPGSERDYLGRSYLHPNTGLDINLTGEGGTQNCFVPKKLLHTWTGHTKGVNTIRFFPKSAHLILSASLDTKVKLWDVYNDRRCLRTFHGHTKSVRDISFAYGGTKFISAGFDKFLKEWDTETGQCISKYEVKKLPWCVTYNPDADKTNIFLMGSQDKKIYQYDSRTGKVTLEYIGHAGGVNSITFVEDNRRFLSTSDDKSIRGWEFDIPVVVKYVRDPTLASMPAVALSHNRKWLACQSLDNTIQIFAGNDKFKHMQKKTLRGHITAGYACTPGFSPDNRFVMSGDSSGLMWFWDWKTGKMARKFQAHDGVVMSCLWNPHESSKVATCSWDATIKYWD